MKSIFLWISWHADPDIVCFQEVFGNKVQKEVQDYGNHHGYDVYFPEADNCFVKQYLRFTNPSGLCILVKQRVRILEPPVQMRFQTCEGVDSLASKGVFALCVELGGKPVWILNTHFQSDFTEIPCIRINYGSVRKQQEVELVEFAKGLCTTSEMMICGDFNQEIFHSLDYWDLEKRTTFPQTGQHLDHILSLHPKRTRLFCRQVHSFPALGLSDHSPMLYEFVMRSSC